MCVSVSCERVAETVEARKCGGCGSHTSRFDGSWANELRNAHERSLSGDAPDGPGRAAAIEHLGVRVRTGPARKPNRQVLLVSAYFVSLAAWTLAESLHHYVLLGVFAVCVFAELSLAMGRGVLMSGTSVFDPSLADRIAAPLIELCGKASCPVPEVVLRDPGTRAAAVMRKGEGPYVLVLAVPVVKRVTTAELRALVAHEVAHIRNQDVPHLKKLHLANFAAAVVVCGGLAVVLRHLSVAFGVYIALLFVLFLASNYFLGQLNRRREWRADREGACLSQDARSLATALTKVDAYGEETRARFLSSFWRVALFPLSARPRTHPTVLDRIEALERLGTGPIDGDAPPVVGPT